MHSVPILPIESGSTGPFSGLVTSMNSIGYPTTSTFPFVVITITTISVDAFSVPYLIVLLVVLEPASKQSVQL